MSATVVDLVVWMTVCHIAQLLHVDPSAPLRWIQKGSLLSTGERIRLRGVKTPGGWRVRREDLDRFLEILTADRLRSDAPAEVKPPAKAPRVAKLNAELVKAGF